MSDAVALHHRYHEAIRRRNFGAIETMMAPDAAYRSAGVGALEGRSAILDAFRRYFAVHPDQVDGDDAIEDVAPGVSRAIWWLRATNAETGATVHRRGIETLTLDAAGRIVLVEVEDEAYPGPRNCNPVQPVAQSAGLTHDVHERSIET